MPKLYDDKASCSGCGACLNVCTRRAIDMAPDQDGFLFPAINADLCNECNACVKVCPFKQERPEPPRPIATYAAVNKDSDVLAGSSSGGVFAALAEIIFERGGAVFGCAYNQDMLPCHIGIETPDLLRKLQGSKYAQSDTNRSFLEVKKLLKADRWVLYTGTPCQIAGLKALLKTDYPRLITADLVCHGVPSAKLFKEHLTHLASQLDAKILDFRFRDKSQGPAARVAKVVFEKHGEIREKLQPAIDSCYYTYFLQGHVLRESCYGCAFAGSTRMGDFTLGDYWGIERIHPEVDTRRGASVLLVNTVKAAALIDELQQRLTLTLSSIEQAQRSNDRLAHKSAPSERRSVVLAEGRAGGYGQLARAYRLRHAVPILKQRLKAVVPQPVRAIAKRILRRHGE